MEDQIIQLLRKRKGGLSLLGIVRELGLNRREAARARKILKGLEGKGALRRRGRHYSLPSKTAVVRGVLVSSSRGYGFVRPEGGESADIFIPGRHAGGALQGDTIDILVRDKGREGKPEGRVIRIVKKGRRNILGIYIERYGQPFFLPLDAPSQEEFPLASKGGLTLHPGMIVEVDRERLELRSALGMPDDAGVDTRVVIEKYGLADRFSEEAEEEARSLSSVISPPEEAGRKDYRKWKTVTIDGETAQDFDDAVSIRRLGSGNFLLGVHIADVSHYVRPETVLDREAFERGTSVYFPDLTLPMLPERLSTDICSLRPKEMRRTFSVLMEIDRKGDVVRTEFHPSLIQTAERMTYTSVFKILQGDEEEKQRFPRLVRDLLLMQKAAALLRRRREAQGSLNFDLREPELVYQEGRLQGVTSFEQNEAHDLIEEFMVAANEAVSTYISRDGAPSLYRVHPSPAQSELDDLRRTLEHFGVSLPKPEKITSKDLQGVLEKVKGRPEEKFVHIAVLRALKLAVYSEENIGHFGLAKKEYTHFTSPIRRYPDLVVHRVLKALLGQEEVELDSLQSLALHCSLQERKADEAEKDLLEWRIYRLLKTKLGEEFTGMIVDISRAGLVVELEDYFVDGIVLFSDLGGDYFSRQPGKRVVGKRTGKTFDVGTTVRVVAAAVDPILRRMNLILSSEGGHRTG